MDRVRLGRALGYGARHAMKSLSQAVDAAKAVEPQQRRPRVAVERPAVPQQVRRVSGAVWRPLKKFSGVLWLQVTGTFFALIAAYLSQGLWAHRAEWKAGSGEVRMYALHVAAFVAFAYFAVSNFVRAWRRERRKA